MVSQCVWKNSSDWAVEFCVRPIFCPEPQLVIVVEKISAFESVFGQDPIPQSS